MVDPLAREIGRRIRERRRMLGLSQIDLACHIGVDQTAVSKWERGLACPSRRHELLILDALNARGTGMFDVRGVA